VRIIAIDASPRRGVISKSVEMAARSAEAAGADVHLVRLCELEIRECTGCMVCRGDGVCKIKDDLPALAEEIAQADGVILGAPSYFHRAAGSTRALLDRLGGYFGRVERRQLAQESARPGARGHAAGHVRRAVIITACAVPEPLATFFGYTTGPVRELRTALGLGGISTIGSLAVTDTWRRPTVHEWEQDKARSLGRVLAGKI
jgi:multimeric flavodoxin WrbA